MAAILFVYCSVSSHMGRVGGGGGGRWRWRHWAVDGAGVGGPTRSAQFPCELRFGRVVGGGGGGGGGEGGSVSETIGGRISEMATQRTNPIGAIRFACKKKKRNGG